MKLALSAKLTINPRRLLQSRWVHDTAHLLASAVRKAREAAGVRKVPKPTFSPAGK